MKHQRYLNRVAQSAAQDITNLVGKPIQDTILVYQNAPGILVDSIETRIIAQDNPFSEGPSVGDCLYVIDRIGKILKKNLVERK